MGGGSLDRSVPGGRVRVRNLRPVLQVALRNCHQGHHRPAGTVCLGVLKLVQVLASLVDDVDVVKDLDHGVLVRHVDHVLHPPLHPGHNLAVLETEFQNLNMLQFIYLEGILIFLIEMYQHTRL